MSYDLPGPLPKRHKPGTVKVSRLVRQDASSSLQLIGNQDAAFGARGRLSVLTLDAAS